MSTFATAFLDETPKVRVEHIVHRLDSGRKLNEDVADYFRKRSEIELQYAAQLTGLWAEMKRPEGIGHSTLADAWDELVKELNQCGSVHAAFGTVLSLACKQMMAFYGSSETSEWGKAQKHREQLLAYSMGGDDDDTTATTSTGTKEDPKKKKNTGTLRRSKKTSKFDKHAAALFSQLEAVDKKRLESAKESFLSVANGLGEVGKHGAMNSQRIKSATEKFDPEEDITFFVASTVNTKKASDAEKESELLAHAVADEKHNNKKGKHGDEEANGGAAKEAADINKDTPAAAADLSRSSTAKSSKVKKRFSIFQKHNEPEAPAASQEAPPNAEPSSLHATTTTTTEDASTKSPQAVFEETGEFPNPFAKKKEENGEFPNPFQNHNGNNNSDSDSDSEAASAMPKFRIQIRSVDEQKNMASNDDSRDDSMISSVLQRDMLQVPNSARGRKNRGGSDAESSLKSSSSNNASVDFADFSQQVPMTPLSAVPDTNFASFDTFSSAASKLEPQWTASITETIQINFQNNKINKAQITGEVDLSLADRSVLSSIDPAKYTLAFQLTGNTEKALVNQAVCNDASEKVYSCKTVALLSELEKSPTVQFLKYRIASTPSFVESVSPLKLTGTWKLEPNRTEISISYEYNAESPLFKSGLLLQEVSILIAVDGGVTQHHAEPEGVWSAEREKFLWDIGDLPPQKREGKLHVLFDVQSTSTQKPIMVKFNSSNSSSSSSASKTASISLGGVSLDVKPDASSMVVKSSKFSCIGKYTYA